MQVDHLQNTRITFTLSGINFFQICKQDQVEITLDSGDRFYYVPVLVSVKGYSMAGLFLQR